MSSRSDVFATVLRLRQQGRQLSHPVHDKTQIKPSALLSGILEMGSASDLGLKGKCLLIRPAMSAPGVGTLAVLYEPRLTAVHHDCFVVRGFEPSGDAGHLQEWVIYVL